MIMNAMDIYFLISDDLPIILINYAVTEKKLLTNHLMSDHPMINHAW